MKALRYFIITVCFFGLLMASYNAPSDVSLAMASSVLSSLLIGYAWGERVGRNSFYPRRIKRGTRKNTVLVVGVGRTGKSCLIEVMTAKLGKKKPLLTNEFSIRSCSWNDGGTIPTYFHFTDYRGQDFSQLVSNFLKQQSVPNSLLRYGDINSLVLVVDIFPYDESESDRTVHEVWDTQRVKAHLDEWNSTALDAVFGLLTEPALKYVCLFINKVDKLRDGDNPLARQRIKDCFLPLSKELERRAVGAEFDIMIGSALRGDAALGNNGSLLDTEKTLLQQLGRLSVPLGREERA